MPNQGDIFPWIQTERLVLDRFDESHVSSLFEIFSSEEAMQYYDLFPFTDPSQCLELIDLFFARFKEKSGIRWGIFLNDNLIGTCGFNSYRANRKGVIGYDLNPKFWGKGYASEAVKAAVEYGFTELQIHRIEAYVSPGNIASEKVLLKNDFEKEGHLREVAYFKNKFQDQLLYARIDPEPIIE